MFIIVINDILSLSQLSDEIRQVTNEPFTISKVCIRFKDIYKSKNYQEDEDGNVLVDEIVYRKKAKVEHVNVVEKTISTINDDGDIVEELVEEEVKTYKTEFIDYTEEFKSVLSKIDEVIANHEPLKYIKRDKIEVLSKTCGEVIVGGIEYNGKQYSAKVEDQISIGTLKPIADAGGSCPWHANGESCGTFTSEEFLDFSSKLMAHVVYHQTYMGGVKDYINSLEDKESIDAFVYGDELPEEIMNNVKSNLALLELQFNNWGVKYLPSNRILLLLERRRICIIRKKERYQELKMILKAMI